MREEFLMKKLAYNIISRFRDFTSHLSNESELVRQTFKQNKDLKPLKHIKVVHIFAP